MSISKRIKLIIESEKKQKDFAEKTGLTTAMVSKIVAKEPDSVNSSTLLAIIDGYPNINPTWLLTGQGDMYLTEEEQAAYSQAQDPAGVYGDKMTERVIDLLEKRVAELEREIKRRDPDLAREIGIE